MKKRASKQLALETCHCERSEAILNILKNLIDLNG